jgi:hypothetical protein
MAKVETYEGRACGLAPCAFHLVVGKRPQASSELPLLQVQAQ